MDNAAQRDASPHLRECGADPPRAASPAGAPAALHWLLHWQDSSPGAKTLALLFGSALLCSAACSCSLLRAGECRSEREQAFR
nr:hypothetical protein [uncultured bacterium]